MRLSLILFSSVACMDLPHFSTLSHTWARFLGNTLPNIKCVFRFSLWICLKHFPFEEELSETSLMYVGLHVKYQLLLSNFNEVWTFSIDFREKLKYQILWNFFHWKSSCFTRIDVREDRMGLTVAFCNFAKAPKTNRVHHIPYSILV